MSQNTQGEVYGYEDLPVKQSTEPKRVDEPIDALTLAKVGSLFYTSPTPLIAEPGEMSLSPGSRNKLMIRGATMANYPVPFGKGGSLAQSVKGYILAGPDVWGRSKTGSKILKSVPKAGPVAAAWGGWEIGEEIGKYIYDAMSESSWYTDLLDFFIGDPELKSDLQKAGFEKAKGAVRIAVDSIKQQAKTNGNDLPQTFQTKGYKEKAFRVEKSGITQGDTVMMTAGTTSVATVLDSESDLTYGVSDQTVSDMLQLRNLVVWAKRQFGSNENVIFNHDMWRMFKETKSADLARGLSLFGGAR